MSRKPTGYKEVRVTRGQVETISITKDDEVRTEEFDILPLPEKIYGETCIGMQMFVPEAMKDYVFPMSQKPKDYRVLNDQRDGGKFVHITGRDGKQHSFVIWPMRDKINGETWYSQSNLLAFDAVCVPRGSNVTGTYPVPPTANHREFVDESTTKKPSG
ncbi:unnamed protein product, partial [Mesorhabditis spiculigera]